MPAPISSTASPVVQPQPKQKDAPIKMPKTLPELIPMLTNMIEKDLPPIEQLPAEYLVGFNNGEIADGQGDEDDEDDLC
jgi:hypothetical protein